MRIGIILRGRCWWIADVLLDSDCVGAGVSDGVEVVRCRELPIIQQGKVDAAQDQLGARARVQEPARYVQVRLCRHYFQPVTGTRSKLPGFRSSSIVGGASPSTLPARRRLECWRNTKLLPWAARRSWVIGPDPQLTRPSTKVLNGKCFLGALATWEGKTGEVYEVSLSRSILGVAAALPLTHRFPY